MTTQSQQNSIKERDEFSLKEFILRVQNLWGYLLSKWLIILLFSLLGASLGFLYAKTKEAIYIATTTFVLEDEKGSGFGNLAGLASIAGIDMGGSGGGIFQGDNILSLYKSRTMLEKTLLTDIYVAGKKQLLVDRYIEFNHYKDKWKEKPELMNVRFNRDSLSNEILLSQPNRLLDSLLGIFVTDLNKNYLNVLKPDKKLSTIQVDVKAKDEIFAKEFNDALVKNVNEFYVNTKTKKTLQNVQILQQKADSVRATMNGAIYTAVAVTDATPNLNPTRQVQRVAPAQRAQFSAETNRAILSEMVKNLELTKMSLLKETPLIQVVDQPIYPLAEEKLGKAKGLILGGVLFGFLTAFSLIIFKMYKNIING